MCASILCKVYIKEHKLRICLLYGMHILGKNSVLASKLFLQVQIFRIIHVRNLREIENEGAKFA